VPSEETGLVEMPSESGLVDTGLGSVGGYSRIPVVSFYGSSAKGDRLTRLKAAGIEMGKFYVQDDAGVMPIKFLFATPANFHVYGKADGQGKIIAIRGKNPGGWRPDFKNPADKGWSDLLLSIVLAPIGDAGLTAAKMQVFKAVTNVFEKVNGVAKQAQFPAAWSARSALHAEAAKAKHWFGRFVIVPSVRDEKKKTSKDTFAQGAGEVLPTPAAFVSLFNDYVESPAWREALEVFGKVKAKLLELPQDA